MATAGTVEIDVELKGTKDVKEGFASISQAGKSLAESVGASNEKLAEGLGAVGESVFGFADSLAELKGSFSAVGTAGGAGFMALLGPIGAVTTAALGLYEVFKMVSGASIEAEQNQAAMAAAAGDLQSKLEALAEKGVVLAADEMQRFSKMTLLAQVAKEKLQFAQEKLTKKTMSYIEAERNLSKLKEKMISLEKEGLSQLEIEQHYKVRLIDLTDRLAKAQNDFNEAIQSNIKDQTEVGKKIAEAEKKYKGYEETSAEFLSTKIKENLEIKKSLELAKAEATLSDANFKKKKIQIEQDTKLALLQAKRNEEDQKALLAQSKKVENELKGLDAVTIANQQADFQRKKLQEQEQKRREAERNKRATAMKAETARRQAQLRIDEQLRMKSIAEQARISQLEIQMEEESTEKQIKLASIKFNTQLQLAKDNFNLQKIALLEYQNEVANIESVARMNRERAREEQEQKLQQSILDNAMFDAQQIENEFDRENELLRLSYEKKFLLAKDNQEQITELNRRYAIERQNIIDNEASKSSELINSFFSDMGRGLAEVAVSSIIMGESFKKGIGTLLLSLAKQAGVQAIMETAKGVAASILNPALASAHFSAAGLFATAAGVAGVAGNTLGGGAGGTGGGTAGGAGIMGSTETAPRVEREQATSSELTFNVNFSGAVIYDTKKAAEQALADRVTKMMNERRRGKPRRNS
jgi:hypothetical protein